VGRLAQLNGDRLVRALGELREVLQAAQTRHQLLVSTPEPAPIERAQFVLSELRASR
jgi:hypothetical protein